MRPPVFVLLLLAVPALAADTPAKPRKLKEDANPLLGEWLRKGTDANVTLKIAEKRLFVSVVEQTPSGALRCLNLNADYAVGPDGRLFGVITGVDCKIAGPNGDTFNAAVSERSKGSKPVGKKLEGRPFAVRARRDGDALTVGELRAEGLKGQPEVLALTGKFERVTANAMAPAAAHGPDAPQRPVLVIPDAAPFLFDSPLLKTLPQPMRTRDIPSGELPPIPILPLREEAPKPRATGRDSEMPSPHYLNHYPTYFPTDPSFPQPRDRESMLDPLVDIRRGIGVRNREETPAPRTVEPVRVPPAPRGR